LTRMVTSVAGIKSFFVLRALSFDVHSQQLGTSERHQSTKFKEQSSVFSKMILAKVLGNVVATQKNVRYESARVMLCEHITPEGDATGHTVIALDAVDAGVGDTVLIVQEGW